MLGIREPEIYGKRTYRDLVSYIREQAEALGQDVSFYQSNHEGDLVDQIQQAYGVYDGIVLNPAAYTHTSVAILDALKAVSIPTVEVHLSDVNSREEFRRVSYVRQACVATVAGKGFDSYIEAIRILMENGQKEN
jgi:3-dehydroquinate dehydratase type II